MMADALNAALHYARLYRVVGQQIKERRRRSLSVTADGLADGGTSCITARSDHHNQRYRFECFDLSFGGGGGHLAT